MTCVYRWLSFNWMSALSVFPNDALLAGNAIVNESKLAGEGVPASQGLTSDATVLAAWRDGGDGSSEVSCSISSSSSSYPHSPQR
jgi:hypothetical protein